LGRKKITEGFETTIKKILGRIWTKGAKHGGGESGFLFGTGEGRQLIEKTKWGGGGKGMWGKIATLPQCSRLRVGTPPLGFRQKKNTVNEEGGGRGRYEKLKKKRVLKLGVKRNEFNWGGGP